MTPRLSALFLLFAACAAPTSGVLEARLPRPVGMEEEGEGAGGHARRVEWIEQIHRAAPGVDWRAIEEENRAAAMERRRSGAGSRAATAGAWGELGSRNLAGSTFVAVPSSNGAELYVGSALGGVFRGPLDGSAWTAIGDNAYGGAHHLVVVPPASGTQDVLLRAVNGRVLRSTDGGATWLAPSGLGSFGDVRRMLALDDAAHTVLLLVKSGNGWKLFRSTDRGASFAQTRSITVIPDLWTPRDALGAVYLWEKNRMYVSADGGQTFAQQGAAMLISPSDVRFGGHEVSNGSTFSLAAKIGGVWELHRTTDGGATWSHVNDMPEMWSAFGTSITDPNTLCYGGVELWVSYDGGANFDVVNRWWEHPSNRLHKLHADIMGVSTVPDPTVQAGERWYVNTHGGTYESKTRLDKVTWLSAVGMGVSQYYSTHTSRRDTKFVHAGAQDQGYQRSVLGTPTSGGPWADFTELITGDYGHLSSSDGSHDLVYSDYPGFVLIYEDELHPVLHSVDFPPGFDGQWLPFLVADPEDKEVFYLLGSRIWRYQRSGPTTWSYSQHSAQTFSPVACSLAFSPLDPDHAWCATTDGKIYRSGDHGVTWTQGAQTGPGAHYFYGSTIVPSAHDLDEVWIAGSGYSTAPVKFSSDRGTTWSDRSAGLPSTLVYCLVEAPDASGRMYAGSETGAWEWDPAAQSWNDLLGADAPLTLYWSVEAVPSQNLIRFGTYGRGAWDYSPDTPGFFPYGELRGAPNVLNLRADRQPLLGATVTLTVAGGPPQSAGMLSVCTRSDEASEFGGWRFVDLRSEVLRLPFATGAGGAAALTVTIPNAPALIGAERFLQAAVRDPAQVQGWALSHGLRARIGS